MMEKVIELLKKSNVSIPYALFKNYKELNINEQELVVLIYIINYSEVFNPKAISEYLKMDVKNVFDIISSLTSKGLIEIEIRKVNNIREEYIAINNLYKKLAFLIVNDEIDQNKPKNNIFDCFEKEFGRTLSPIEYELINAWLDKGNSEEIVLLALKEAIYNGVSNLRYIDRILNEWQKKGIKTKEDIEKEKIKFNSSKKNKELFDYDWLNENDK